MSGISTAPEAARAGAPRAAAEGAGDQGPALPVAPTIVVGDIKIWKINKIVVIGNVTPRVAVVLQYYIDNNVFPRRTRRSTIEKVMKIIKFVEGSRKVLLVAKNYGVERLMLSINLADRRNRVFRHRWLIENWNSNAPITFGDKFKVLALPTGGVVVVVRAREYINIFDTVRTITEVIFIDHDAIGRRIIINGKLNKKPLDEITANDIIEYYVPAKVRRHIESGRPVYRQGDIWLLPLQRKPRINVKDYCYRETKYMTLFNSHELTGEIIINKCTVKIYVKNPRLEHPEHGVLTPPPGWYIVMWNRRYRPVSIKNYLGYYAIEELRWPVSGFD